MSTTPVQASPVVLAFKLRTMAKDVEDAVHINFDDDVDQSLAALTL